MRTFAMDGLAGENGRSLPGEKLKCFFHKLNASYVYRIYCSVTKKKLFWMIFMNMYFSRFWMFFDYFAFQCFYFRRTSWRLLQKRVVCTRFDIYVFIIQYGVEHNWCTFEF